jgi:large-conductance mechanosensitive channel
MIVSEIIEFIGKNTLYLGITIALLASFVNQLVFSFINDIIMPIIDRDGNNDNQPDINKIADFKIKTAGITFKVGAFILALIRFILLLFIIFFLCVVLVKLKKENKI